MNEPGSTTKVSFSFFLYQQVRTRVHGVLEEDHRCVDAILHPPVLLDCIVRFDREIHVEGGLGYRTQKSRYPGGGLGGQGMRPECRYQCCRKRRVV